MTTTLPFCHVWNILFYIIANNNPFYNIYQNQVTPEIVEILDFFADPDLVNSIFSSWLDSIIFAFIATPLPL